jgi:hypothetical protein
MVDRSIEERLSAAFGADMTSTQRAWVDKRVDAALSYGSVRRWSGLRLRRSALLVGALLILAPSGFVVGAAILSTEAPYGMGNAEAYDAELKAAKAVTPIPPGATWPPYLEQAQDRSASYGVGLGTQMVEVNAFCLWLGDWYDANERGDATAKAEATVALERTRGWTTFTDPFLSDAGFRAIHSHTIDAAVEGDTTTVLQQLQTNCTGTWDATK